MKMSLASRRTALKILGAGAVLIVLATTVAWSMRKPSAHWISVSGSFENFADESVVYIGLNGKWAGSADRANQRKSTGGGVVCCVPVDLNGSDAQVEVRLADGSSYTTPARLIQPVPEVVSYANIYLLPDRKAIVWLTPLMDTGALDYSFDDRLVLLRKAHETGWMPGYSRSR
jgi:hypothetical protein